jgi:hypothetical protein
MATKPLPESFISQELVNMRTSLYAADIHQKSSIILKSRHGERAEETRSVWFSISQVAEWLTEMINLGANGLRIYLGQKEDPSQDATTHIDPNPYAPLPGQLCLMIVLTKQGDQSNSTDTHKNIVYEKLSDYQQRLDLTPTMKHRSMNAGSYSPPLRITVGDDYPNDSLTLPE